MAPKTMYLTNPHGRTVAVEAARASALIATGRYKPEPPPQPEPPRPPIRSDEGASRRGGSKKLPPDKKAESVESELDEEISSTPGDVAN